MWEKKGNSSSVEEVCLGNLGVGSTDEINGWFLKHRDPDGYGIKNLKEAAEMLRDRKNDPVYILGDYDVDGICAASLLWLGLKKAGFSDVHYRLPKRFSEGYGLSVKAVDEIAESNAVVLTCDNGIAAIDAVAHAKEKGLTVIVTDHHLPPVIDGEVVLPGADIIVNPKVYGGGFNDYCGAGIAWKLIRELLGKPNEPYAQFLQPLAAVATICDSVPLREENYVLTRNGLKRLEAGLCTEGLMALIKLLGLTEHITADDIGFKIGPCLNAPGRLYDDGATISARLLIGDGDIRELSSQVKSINEIRKDAVKKAMEKAETIVSDGNMSSDVPIVVYLPKENEGIIGIIAGQLTEKYRTPSLVLTDAEEGFLKGSARSVDRVNIKELFDMCPELFVKYGGHAAAAGFTIHKEGLDTLRETLMAKAKAFNYDPADAGADLYDLEIRDEEVPDLISRVEAFSPFGEGNPPVIFKVDFDVAQRNGLYKTSVGGNGLKLYSDTNVVGIGFGLADSLKDVEKPKKVFLYGTLSNNYFRDTVTPQVEFRDVEVLEEEKFEPNRDPFLDDFMSIPWV